MTYPEDTNGIERAVRRPVGLDHAEHTMELPVDEEHNEKVVRIPEAFKVCTAALLHRVPDHNTQCKVHDPARRTGPSREVRREERDDALAGGGRARIRHGELVEVAHVRCDVDDGPKDDRPSDHLMESDVLIEGDNVVERRAPEDGDEVPADGEEDEDHIDVQDERSRTGNHCSSSLEHYNPTITKRSSFAPLTESDTKRRTRSDFVILEGIVEPPKEEDQAVKEDD